MKEPAQRSGGFGRWLRRGVALVTLAAVVAIAVWESQSLTSPGPLHPSHDAVAKLTGGAGCNACHGTTAGSLAKACTACHDTIQAQLDTRGGLHGALEPAAARRCGDCHAEHHGAQVALVQDASFTAAGVPDPAKYRHTHIAGFTLAGRHTELECETCHKLAQAPKLAEGERRYLGLEQSCTTCHEDVHKGTFGNRCAYCHGQAEAWDAVAGVPGALHPSHANHPPLQGTEGCLACHGDGTKPVRASCLACHERIGTQITEHRGLHGALDAALAPDCTRCHREHTDGTVALVDAQAWAEAGVPDAAAYDHAHLPAFPLTGKHRATACERCHALAGAAALTEGQRRFDAPATTCTACHADVHEGAYGTDCASCHGQERPFPEAPSFEHDPRFALTGGHARVACARCHAAGTRYAIDQERAKRVDAVRDCTACHGTPHGPPFLHAAAEAAGVAANATCTACHRAAHGSFLHPAAQLSAPAHAGTGFALTAPHDHLACTQCHAGIGTRPPLPDDDRLRAAFAKRFPGRKADACEACHATPHGDQFGAGAKLRRCRECHATAHFLPSVFDAARHARSRFPLDGAHAAVACTRCHPAAKAGAPRRFVPTPTDCAACHTDPHQGAFDRPGLPATVGGRAGCARCHDAQQFRTVAWTGEDHGEWAGYRLVGGHARARCDACHRRLPKPDARGTTLGKAPRNCAGCHADPHAGQFIRKGTTDCLRCHDPEGSFTRLRFDHQRDTRFPLDTGHRTLQCGACHKRMTLASGATLVRYRPLGRQCADCHKPGTTGNR